MNTITPPMTFLWFVIVLATVVLLILGHRGHLSTAIGATSDWWRNRRTTTPSTKSTTTPAAPSQPKPSGGCFGFIFKWGCLVLLLFILLQMGACSIVFIRTAMSTTKQGTDTTTNRTPKLYLFSDFPSGEISAPIKAGEIYFYPKGGEIEITCPKPAIPWRDKPGTTMPKVILPSGECTIKKVDANAWGVEIWN